MDKVDPILLARQIDAFCAANGIPKAEFAQNTGVSVATLSQWRNGKYNPSEKNISSIEEYVGMPIEAFLGGKPSIPSFISASDDLSIRISALDEHGRDAILALLACEEARMAKEAEKSDAEPEKVVKLIRHYFSSPAAGVGGMEAGEDYEDIPLPDDAPQNADYCLTVSGDSMEPYIEDGSMVYVQKDVRLDNFDVGVFIVDGVAYIKQYCSGYAGEQYLLSANPKRRDANITIYPSGNLSFVYKGKVILKKKLPQPIYD